jgi:hypothetical protein
VIQHLGEDRVFWSAYEAIVAADHYRANVAGKRKTSEMAHTRITPAT